jgi:hypothetical protein
MTKEWKICPWGFTSFSTASCVPTVARKKESPRKVSISKVEERKLS